MSNEADARQLAAQIERELELRLEREHGSFTPAIATPLALGVPVFLQAGVFDWAQIRASQAASRIFAN